MLPSPVIGIGKDTQGAFYVAAGTDPGTGSPRVFVSAGDDLAEQYVTGSGMSGGGGSTSYSMSFIPEVGATSSARTLVVPTQTTARLSARALVIASAVSCGTKKRSACIG